MLLLLGGQLYHCARHPFREWPAFTSRGKRMPTYEQPWTWLRCNVDDHNLKVYDEMLPEVDEHESLSWKNDDECTEKVSKSDFTPCGWSSFENSSSESESEDFGGIDNGSFGISPRSAVSVSKGVSGTLTICGLHGTFTSNCGCQSQSKKPKKFENSNSNTRDKNEVISFEPKLNFKWSSFPSPTVQHNNGSQCQDMRSKEFQGRKSYAKNSADASNVNNIITQKRSRTPNKRYNQEATNLRSKTMKGKHQNSFSSKDKHTTSNVCTERHQVGFRRLKLDSEKISSEGGTIQRPFRFRGYPNRHASTSDHDSEDESYTDESDDDYQKTIKPPKVDDRRKHQIMWTLSEVITLVDGISQYGVGRWTEIKKMFFSSSDYRTPVDLRDKWRNLLKASSNTSLHSEGEDEQKLRQALPRSLLQRVSDLAAIYPYPKQGTSKKTAPAKYKESRPGRKAARR